MKDRTERKKPDAEISAMRRIADVLEGLPEGARDRVVAWMRDRYLGPGVAE